MAPSTTESARKDSAAAGTESYVHSRQNVGEEGGNLQQKQHAEHARVEPKHNWRNTARGELILNKISVVQFDCWMCQPQMTSSAVYKTVCTV